MTYLAELHAAHKARIARLGGKTPIERKVVPNPHQVEAPPASEPVAPVRAITIPRSAHRSAMMARDIVRIVGAAFNVTPAQIMVKDRTFPVCQARQVAVLLLKKHANISWAKVGVFLGGYETSSLRHSRSRIRRLIESDPDLMSIVVNIEREIAELPRE
jgi:Bacterial dnaA protein helix-turn-helix